MFQEVLDHETWTMNLKEANEGDNEPKWYKLYSAKDAYEMNSLEPSEWNKLIEKNENYYRDSSKRPLCDSQCKLQILCDLKSGRSHDRHHLCHDLEYNIGL
ncbi:hypothetical protein NQ318_006162 [Aromia moschata]|uniref:Uncharacterized protein n=1 Tax=Aromia moschata TaxID=1265417 RepID=A0AAV8XM30_9CUCU|nr:hypothetical protein NQ318_006162 [Aromia moschata]